MIWDPSTLAQLSAPGFNRAIGAGDVVPYWGNQPNQGGVSGADAATPGASFDPGEALGGPTGSIGAGGGSALNNLSSLTPIFNQIIAAQQQDTIQSGQGNAQANPLPGAVSGPSSQGLEQQIAASAGGVPIAGGGGVPGIAPPAGGSTPSGDPGADAGAAPGGVGAPGGPAGAPGDGTAGGIGGTAAGGEGGPGGPGAPGGAPGDGTAGGIGGSAPGGEGGAPGNSGEGGAGGGAGGAGSTVICTELYRQGLMSEATRRADELFGRSLPLVVMVGYRLWAAPLARKMASSPRLTRVVASVALPWAKEMAYQMGARSTGSLAGRVVMAIGVPLCAAIGCVIARRMPSTKGV